MEVQWPVTSFPFDAITLESLRKRQSTKWRMYGDDVVPAWVAEMDFPIAAPIRQTLQAALDDDDLGYAHPLGLGDAFAAWAARTWGWRFRPADVSVAPDVVRAIELLLRAATSPGDTVVIDPPAYPPFASTIARTGRVIATAPLTRDGARFTMDFNAVERAYANGAKLHLLCSPHNPCGFVLRDSELETLAALAERYDVLILSDEIHAPLVLGDAVHRPFPTVSEAASDRCIVVTSASKAWNLAGLKAAMIVATSARTHAIVDKLPPTTPHHAGHLGVLAAQTAFREGDPWLDDARRTIDRNRHLLANLLATHLPEVRYTPPEASYLAWLDCAALHLGDDPANVFLARGKVALSPGPSFGVGGAMHARLNIATTPTLLEEAVRRMAIAVRA